MLEMMEGQKTGSVMMYVAEDTGTETGRGHHRDESVKERVEGGGEIPGKGMVVIHAADEERLKKNIL